MSRWVNDLIEGYFALRRKFFIEGNYHFEFMPWVIEQNMVMRKNGNRELHVYREGNRLIVAVILPGKPTKFYFSEDAMHVVHANP